MPRGEAVVEMGCNNRRTALALLPVVASNALQLPRQPAPPPSGRTTVREPNRRAFLAATSAAAIALSGPPPARAAPWDRKKPEDVDRASALAQYNGFKEMLSANRLASVEFGFDGRSIKFVDADGRERTVDDPPDDPTLLKELYASDVEVSVKAFAFQKQLNSASWMRELMGEDLTAEELYKYRGYKTLRQNQPENNYIPSNLITGYDLSRNMYANEQRSNFFKDLSYFLKNGNQPNEPR